MQCPACPLQTLLGQGKVVSLIFPEHFLFFLDNHDFTNFRASFLIHVFLFWHLSWHGMPDANSRELNGKLKEVYDEVSKLMNMPKSESISAGSSVSSVLVVECKNFAALRGLGLAVLVKELTLEGISVRMDPFDPWRMTGKS